MWTFAPLGRNADTIDIAANVWMCSVICPKVFKGHCVTFHNHFESYGRDLQRCTRPRLSADCVGLIPPSDCSGAHASAESCFLDPDNFIRQHWHGLFQ